MLEQRLQTVRRWLGPMLCLCFLLSFAVLHISCDQCPEGEKSCDQSCSTRGSCLIEYTYDPNGAKTGMKRSCRWFDDNAAVQCGSCTNIKKDDKDRVISQQCTVCNVCNSEFQCFKNEDCKGSTPSCRNGICSECGNDGDCPKERPVCTDNGCTCTKDADCEDQLMPVCVADVDKDKPKRCGCSTNDQCKNKEYPACKDDQTCGCATDKDCSADKNFPHCVEGSCRPCQCGSRQPRQPYCQIKSDGSVACVECLEDSMCTNTGFRRCDPKAFTCVACAEDKDCKDPAKPSCDASTGECIVCQCKSKDENKPVCLKNADNTVTCVACTQDSDCSSPTPVCNTKTNTCEASCKDNNDCTAEKPYCDGGECVACRGFQDCKNPQRPRCISGVCSCLKDSDCPQNQFPTCSPEKKQCVECAKNADCSPGFPVCSTDGVCQLLPCDPGSGGKECGAVPNRPLCREVARRYVCVGCTKDADCSNGQTCDLSKFVCSD